MLRTVGRWVAYPIIAGLLVALVTLIVTWLKTPPRVVDESFSIASFDATYELELQPDGTLDALISERIDVDFAAPGKHGIVRIIPLKYQDHRNAVTDISVTGQLRTSPEEGPSPDQEAPVRFTESRTDTAIELRLGSSITTLAAGAQRFTLSYRLTEIAMNTPNGLAQEVALDVTGSGWGVPTARAQATLVVPASLAERLNGNAACYFGVEGSTERCSISRAGADPVTFSSTTSDLSPFESMTFAVGFIPGTFDSAYTPRQTLWAAVALVSAPLGAAIAIALLVVIPPAIRRWRLNRRVLVTQFTPPKGVTPLVAADVWGRPERGMAAQLIDAVVTRQLTVITKEAPGSEAEAGVSASRQARQRRQLRSGIKLQGLNKLNDQGVGSLLRSQFRNGVHSAPSPSAMELRRSLVKESGQRLPGRAAGSWFLPTYVLFLIGLGVCNLLGLNVSLQVAWWNIAAAVLAVCVLVFALYRGGTSGRLSPDGEETYHHLRGLRHFMALSEAERIRFLQGTDTAPRVGSGDATTIKLYEPLLPYAVIFGLEDSWGRLIGDHGAVSPGKRLSAAAGSVLVSGLLSERSDRTYRSDLGYYNALAMTDTNHRVGAGFTGAGKALSEWFSGSNDGTDGRGGGWSGGDGGGNWSSGSSDGGGSSGSGMGGGGGSSW